MKRSQIVLFAIFIVLAGLIYIPVAMNSKSYQKNIKKESKTIHVPYKIVQNSPHTITLSSYGQISPITELMVSFEVQGKLVEGKKRLKPGAKFSKGDVLYIIDAEEMFYSIAARKTALKGIIAQSIPDLNLDFPKETEKWIQFMDAVGAREKLPEYPRTTNNKEALFWITRNVKTEYYSILSLEKRYEKYTYRAPFSGTVVEIYSEPGSIVNPGVQIAKIAKTGEFELKVPVALSDLRNFKESNTAQFVDSKEQLVATGNILRISDVVNQRTQSVDVYYSVKPEKDAIVYNGMFLNVTIDQQAEKNTVVLPRTAVSNRKVWTLEGAQLVAVDINEVGMLQDSLYIEGLSNGTKVVLEQIGTPSKDIIYEGVERK